MCVCVCVGGGGGWEFKKKVKIWAIMVSVSQPAHARFHTYAHIKFVFDQRVRKDIDLDEKQASKIATGSHFVKKREV